MKTKVLKYALEEKPLYVVLYWVGSPNHPNSSIRATGALSLFEKRIGKDGRETNALELLKGEFHAQGYQTSIVSRNEALEILKRLNPLPKERKPPKFSKPDKKARKAPKAAEKFSKYREVRYTPSF